MVKFQISWRSSLLGATKSFHKAVNDKSCKLKISWWQNYLFHVCMLTFFTFSWEFSAWEFLVSSSVHSKFQESSYYYLVITLWKCEYCLIWVLNKSILFGSNSVKVSLLCDMYSKKSFYYSVIWKKLSIVWCLEKCVVLLGVTPWKCQYCLIWNLKHVSYCWL